MNKWTDKEKKPVWKGTTDDSIKITSVENGIDQLLTSPVSKIFWLNATQNKCRISPKNK